MSKSDNKDFNVGLQLKSIEILKSNLSLPPTKEVVLNKFNFNINLESKADPKSKMLFVIVSVEISSEDRSHILGSLTASCIYEIINFKENIKIEVGGEIIMPQQLTDMLNSISISTIRGVMFSTFKGTFLHNAILPIIDPRQFISSEI